MTLIVKPGTDIATRCATGAPLLAIALTVLLPFYAFAAEPKTEASTLEAALGAKISKDQAKQSALQSLPGEVTDITVESKGGKRVYVIEIVSKQDQVETDVLVDMSSGKVLGMER